MLPSAHKFLPILALILSLTHSAFSFIQSDVQDHNEILKSTVSAQSGTLGGSLGLVLDKFAPGTQFDINGANFTIGEQEIVAKPDQGLEDIKVGIEVIGNKAAVFGGWAPVGVIDNLPENEKIRVENNDNVVEIDLQTNDDLTKTVVVNFNGEEVLNQGGVDQLVVFVDINEEEENLKVAYSDGVNTVKVTEDLNTGEISFGDIETESYEYVIDQVSGFEATMGNKTGAMIKKLTEEQLKQLENGKTIPINNGEKESDVDIAIIQREVTVYQKGESVGSFVLEKQEVLQFVDRRGRIAEVLLTPEGTQGVKADIIVNGEAVDSKEAENQLEIEIDFIQSGIKIKMEADGEVTSF